MSKSQLKKAIEDTEEPTPGYLYREIAQATIQSAGDLRKITKYLFGKLETLAGVHATYKTLHLVRVLCEMGHSDFQRAAQEPAHARLLEQWTAYRGAPDVRHGDALNARIRDEARQALQAAYAARDDSGAGAGAGAGGAARYGGFGGGGGGDDRHLEGLQAPVFTTSGGARDGRIADMPAGNLWAERQEAMRRGDFGDGGAGGTEALARRLAQTAKASVALLYGGAAGPSDAEELSRRRAREAAAEASSRGAFQPVTITASPATNEATSGAAAVAPSACADGDLAQFSEFLSPSARAGAAPAAGSSFGFINGGGPPAPPAPAPAPASAAAGVREVEDAPANSPAAAAAERARTLVQRYAALPTAPQRVALRQFSEAVASLCGDDEEAVAAAVAAACDECLAPAAAFQRRLNALSCLEALAAGAEPALAGVRAALTRHYRAHPEPVLRNARAVQQRLSERAAHLRDMMELPSEAPPQPRQSASSGPAASAPQQPPAQSLFPASAAAAAVEADGGGGGGAGGEPRVLDGMVVRERRAKKATAAPRTLFGEGAEAVGAPKRRAGSFPQTAPAAADAPQPLLFEPAAAAAANQQQQQQRSTNGSAAAAGDILDDLFGAPAAPSSTSAAPAAAHSAVDDLFAPTEAPSAAGGDDDDYAVAVRLQTQLDAMLAAAQSSSSSGSGGGGGRPDPDALARLQDMMRRQQQLLARIQRREASSAGAAAGSAAVYYDFPTYGLGDTSDAARGGGGSPDDLFVAPRTGVAPPPVRNEHAHFSSGAAAAAAAPPSASRGRQQLAEAQEEMKRALQQQQQHRRADNERQQLQGEGEARRPTSSSPTEAPL